MKMWRNLLLLSTLVSFPSLCYGDPGDNYCIKPAFITATIKPNLLLMIDNSASMYDLAYVDRGKKHCSVTTSKPCTFDSDCPGETCSVFERQPFYCYDETYSNANVYTGTFKVESAPGVPVYYQYRTDSEDFAELANFADGCPGAAGETVKSIPGTMCVQYTTANGALKKFAAKGNYLNWLTASKMDVEKGILTGGKWDGTGIISESRGCVGQGFVKQALTSDFVNFAGTAANDQNLSLGVTFTVTGPPNEFNATAPSSGGPTRINIYAGKVYDYANCQKAVTSIASGTNADVKQDVAACLASSSPASGTCQQDNTQSCTTSSECVRSSANSQSSFVCSLNPSKTCSGTTDISTCSPADVNVCSQKNSISCTGASDVTSCIVTTAQKLGSCGAWSPQLPNSLLNKVPTTCSAATCSYVDVRGTSTTTYTAPCNGYVPASTTNHGPCVNISPNYGTCIPNYFGPCSLPSGTVQTKSKISFQQSMQACWSLRNGGALGVDDINTVKNQCSDIYGSYATCSNNRQQTCTDSNQCGGGTCDTGPDAISAGSPALLCGTGYEGQFFEKNSKDAWVLKSTATTAAMIAVHAAFCNALEKPRVTDPSDAPSDTAVADNLPAIISGIGVEAQLGQPSGTMQVKLATAAEPTGLVQQFQNDIRIGAMSFNPVGSASETSLSGMSVAQVCSNSPETSCVDDSDCGTGQCEPTTNLDGGRILYPIGKGVCATLTGAACSPSTACGAGESCVNKHCVSKGTTVCTTANNCSAGEVCISDGVGAHTQGNSLVKAIDDVRAHTWTPLAEAFYNAIGYFAQVPSGADAGKSRTALRLNGLRTSSTDYSTMADAPVDFNEALNPSEYRCQQNYVLLISDGSSTADRNSNVNGVASLYAAQAGITPTTCRASGSATTDYGGNNNLPILTWLAKNRRISDFSLSGTPSTAVPGNARDSITSYVVFNGEGNGAAGDCNSLTLLTKAAAKGGTTIKQASNPKDLEGELKKVFQEVAAKAASGTAASILSNSEGSGANILQAVFYPRKIFQNQTYVDWIGEMQNLWYYVDPYINNSTIREDTVGDLKLNLLEDEVVRFAFDDSSNKTMVQRYVDTDGDGTGNSPDGGLIDPDDVKAIWRAGEKLWKRNVSTSARTIYTPQVSGGTEVLAPGSVGTGLMSFDWASLTAPTALAPYLQAATPAAASKIMKYVQGFDFDDAALRKRGVKKGAIPADIVNDPKTTGVGVWKLGDIISSTPRVQSTVRLGTYNLTAPGGYNDNSYLSFVNSDEYQERGMVYVGANDGMLHAFNLGVLSVKSSGHEKATLTAGNSGQELGHEMWAFIPTNYLPYLNYSQDKDYEHLYGIDGRTVLVDASIGDTGTGSCVKASYWDCDKPTTASVVRSSTDNRLDPAKNTWRTVVIGGMGLGGASAKAAATNFVTTPVAHPAQAGEGLGYSSYFALDVTDPVHPKLLWEFTNPSLGYATTGPAIVRLGNAQKNGRWFAVFGSGPTGPIDTDTDQFLGNSSQRLKFFVVDLRTGDLVWTIDSGIDNAFAGSLTAGAIDADRWDPTTTGNYQDDAIYVGYVKKPAAGTTWTAGGVGRIMINRDQSQAPTDANLKSDSVWKWSVVASDLGPVTTSIARLQDRKNRNLWLYGGTGRYFYRDSVELDDNNNRRKLFGIKEPCYNKGNIGNYLDRSCEDSISGTLENQTDGISEVGAGDSGWVIDLDVKTTAVGAERVVTDTVALTNGTVFFTSFTPTMDVCGYGGNSYLWGVKYDNGDAAASNALTGKALIQLSTGEFKEVDLATAFTDKRNRRMSTPLTGKPPSDAPPIISNSTNKPVRKILHIQER